MMVGAFKLPGNVREKIDESITRKTRHTVNAPFGIDHGIRLYPCDRCRTGGMHFPRDATKASKSSSLTTQHRDLVRSAQMIQSRLGKNLTGFANGGSEHLPVVLMTHIIENNLWRIIAVLTGRVTCATALWDHGPLHALETHAHEPLQSHRRTSGRQKMKLDVRLGLRFIAANKSAHLKVIGRPKSGIGK